MIKVRYHEGIVRRSVAGEIGERIQLQEWLLIQYVGGSVDTVALGWGKLPWKGVLGV